MKITPRRGHILGVVLREAPAAPDTTVTFDPSDSSSVVGAFGTFLQAFAMSPLLAGLQTATPLVHVRVLATDPAALEDVERARAKHADESKSAYERDAAKYTIDDYERNAIRVGDVYAVMHVLTVGVTTEGRILGARLGLFTPDEIVAQLDYDAKPSA